MSGNLLWAQSLMTRREPCRSCIPNCVSTIHDQVSRTHSVISIDDLFVVVQRASGTWLANDLQTVTGDIRGRQGC